LLFCGGFFVMTVATFADLVDATCAAGQILLNAQQSHRQ